VGRPLAGVEVRVVDPADPQAAVLPGDPGEVWVRGANVFAGYWGDDAATQLALDADGWLHTGDIAVVTEHGALQLIDRRKDLIIVSGFNVYPAEVEEVLDADPSVRAVAVTGEPDAKTGEAVVAWVVPDPQAELDLAALQARCRSELARYKCPVRIEVVAELPRTATGKVLRRALRA
jgi:long-chain acyl-CoA synthetase